MCGERAPRLRPVGLEYWYRRRRSFENFDHEGVIWFVATEPGNPRLIS